MLALGVALVLVTSNVMQAQAQRDGIALARSIESYASQSVPEQAFTVGVLGPAESAVVTDQVDGFRELRRLRIWTVDGTLLYDSQADATGFPDGDRLDAATRQRQPVAEVVTEVRGEEFGGTETTLLDVYVPVQHDGVVVGAAEVMLDYQGTSDAVAAATRTVTLVVVGGLVLLWLLLFRTVWNASRRLQSSALENARLALLDSLTGLPNRRMLADRLERAIGEHRETGSIVGLALLDIDRFKDINDSLGHDRGDELLQQVADRLRGDLREEDVVARLGGDEFAILLPDVRSVADADAAARRVRQLFVPPFMLGELALHVDTSIGVACLPDHADDASSLMRMADVAMYTAKTHRLGVSVYSPEEDDSSPARLVLLGDLHRALGVEDELELHYQPKIDLRTGRTVGLEALMRWRHPTRGMLPPDLFVPLAEQSGLIHDLTRYALRTCVAQLERWQAMGEPVPVAVNLSAHDVTSHAVVEVIEGLLAAHDVPSSLLEVEITETALVSDPSRVVPVLQRLADLGVHVSIDDFGIGNTSISQLRDLPVHGLKIDRLFVADMSGTGREGSEVIVKAMVDLAHSFGLQVVAEGVEDSGTAEALRRLTVDQAQGYLYSPAVPADRLRAEDLPRHNPVTTTS
ncbi:putative bifunctional diguanylate cyclase/phosphodiesterase [Cellulomonas hominis]|uniref:putative bifunctional diguanylate cyclase/phosphodiesterase n=1 Tax=Cellulomonas hominis TaxID=156981 RepID=UPI001BA089E5|nr:EAL domain-containing protein [Cellulomonas hominis]VTR75339.1 Cyclic di-GMP phosphodiesterase Gmr [Cellulomonas hominis]